MVCPSPSTRENSYYVSLLRLSLLVAGQVPRWALHYNGFLSKALSTQTLASLTVILVERCDTRKESSRSQSFWNKIHNLECVFIVANILVLNFGSLSEQTWAGVAGVSNLTSYQSWPTKNPSEYIFIYIEMHQGQTSCVFLQPSMFKLWVEINAFKS